MLDRVKDLPNMAAFASFLEEDDKKASGKNQVDLSEQIV